MSADHSVSASQSDAASSDVSAARSQHSNRTSPFPPKSTMAAATASHDARFITAQTFLPGSHAFRSSISSIPTVQSRFPLGMSSVNPFERESNGAVAAPFGTSPSPPLVPTLIRRLPLNTSEESLRLMVVWSKDLADVELLAPAQSEDPGFRSAILRFKSIAGAMEAKNMLDGRSNISNDAEMVVEVLTCSPPPGMHYLGDSVMVNPPSAASSGPTSVSGSRQPSRYNGAFSPNDQISPTSNGAFSPHDLPNPDASAHYQNLFSPQSPIGNHLTERVRISGKTLINNDFGDDDETTDLLNDPVAYAENGATAQRRATAPQIPVARMAGLSLNTGKIAGPGPSSLPPYMSATPAHQSAMSPMSPPSAAGNYSSGGSQHFSRHNFPPVNPADQNPPCNTLYVGNLPIDTSEEELKAMFSKQRGYKRLCFRTKQNGPMCFVEFEDVSFATKALHELYGHPLHNSIKGGIRLSFSKNPLGVRSGQGPPATSPGPAAGISGMSPGMLNSFTTTNGPPPGLSAPPGLGGGRPYFHLASPNLTSAGGNGNGNGNSSYHVSSLSGGISNNPWNNPRYNNPIGGGPSPSLNADLNGSVSVIHGGNHSSSLNGNLNNGMNNGSSFVPSRMLGK